MAIRPAKPVRQNSRLNSTNLRRGASFINNRAEADEVWETDDEGPASDREEEQQVHSQLKEDYRKNVTQMIAIIGLVTIFGSLVTKLILIVFGCLLPSYNTYKAIRSMNVKLYVRWMMYWAVFGILMVASYVTDTFISWAPFYYQTKCLIVYWLASPSHKGSSVIYRKFVHPFLAQHEEKIDKFIYQKQDEAAGILFDLSKKGFEYAKDSAVLGVGKLANAAAEKGYTKETMITNLLTLAANDPTALLKKDEGGETKGEKAS